MTRALQNMCISLIVNEKLLQGTSICKILTTKLLE